MKKLLFVLVLLFVLPLIVSADELQDLEKKRDELVMLSQQNSGRLLELNKIIDTLYKEKIALSDQQQQIRNKFLKLLEQIDKLNEPQEKTE